MFRRTTKNLTFAMSIFFVAVCFLAVTRDHPLVFSVSLLPVKSDSLRNSNPIPKMRDFHSDVATIRLVIQGETRDLPDVVQAICVWNDGDYVISLDMDRIRRIGKSLGMNNEQILEFTQIISDQKSSWLISPGPQVLSNFKKTNLPSFCNKNKLAINFSKESSNNAYRAYLITKSIKLIGKKGNCSGLIPAYYMSIKDSGVFVAGKVMGMSDQQSKELASIFGKKDALTASLTPEALEKLKDAGLMKFITK